MQVIAALDADVLVLTAVDYDHDLVALRAFADALEQVGQPYPHLFATLPNTGMATGLDLDGNGKLGEARDAMGYGRFAGQAGMAVLSRLPIDTEQMRDFSGFLWRDLPGNLMPPDTPKRDRGDTASVHHRPLGSAGSACRWCIAPAVDLVCNAPRL